MVPNDFESLTIDYVKEQNYPLVLVTSGKLGSINHTLLSLYACRQEGIRVDSVIYNLYPQIDRLIEDNTLDYLRQYLRREWPGTNLFLLSEEKETGTAKLEQTSL